MNSQFMDFQEHSNIPQFVEAYKKNYHLMTVGKIPKRFVVYQELDDTGWGNKLRAIYSAFLLALVTDRILLIDYPLLLSTFDPPSGIEWSFLKYKKLLKHERSKYYLDPCHKSDEMSLLKISDLNISFPQKVLVHTQGNAFDEAIASNPHYSEKLKQLLGNYQSRLSRTAQIMQFLLQQPKPQFLTCIQQHKNKYGLDKAYTTIAIQFRTFYDIGSPNLKYINYFFDCIKLIISSDLVQSSFGDKPLKFLITSDDLTVTEDLAKRLELYGEVVFDKRPIIHTGSSNRYFKALDKLQKIIPKYSQNNSQTSSSADWSFLLTRKFRRLSNLILLDWYLLGECDILISTMTSYAAFAAAREGNRQTIFKICGESGYCNLISDEEYKKCF